MKIEGINKKLLGIACDFTYDYFEEDFEWKKKYYLLLQMDNRSLHTKTQTGFKWWSN